jgi:predicted dithiol-disulfide oxidoreductase (DUF899 family)
MHGPNTPEGCPGCTFAADNFDGAVVHLNHRDVNIVRDDELMALSAFALEDGVVYHTYSCYDRGTDVLNPTWQLLDRAPKGRGGDFEDWPRRHDEYEDAGAGTAA